MFPCMGYISALLALTHFWYQALFLISFNTADSTPQRWQDCQQIATVTLHETDIILNTTQTQWKMEDIERMAVHHSKETSFVSEKAPGQKTSEAGEFGKSFIRVQAIR